MTPAAWSSVDNQAFLHCIVSEGSNHSGTVAATTPVSGRRARLDPTGSSTASRSFRHGIKPRPRSVDERSSSPVDRHRRPHFHYRFPPSGRPLAPTQNRKGPINEDPSAHAGTSTMNGYCEYHTFDRAVDVCNVCYGDLCRSCVVMLAGRRHATCKECVIDLSGVRTLARPVERGDKATVNARREQYATVDEDEYFQFFTSSATSERSTEAEPVPERRRGRFRFGRNRSATGDDDVEVAGRVSGDGRDAQNPDPAGHSEFHQGPRPAKAVTRLDRLRRSLHHGETETGEGTAAEPTTTNADEKATDRPELCEHPPDPALAMATVSATPEPLTEPEDVQAGVQPQPRSRASQPATTGLSPVDQTPKNTVPDPTARPDAREEPEQFEPADLSVDPFEIAGSRSFEPPVLRYRPEPSPPTPNAQTQAPPPPPQTRAPQPPKPTPPTPNTQAPQPPKPTPPTPNTQAPPPPPKPTPPTPNPQTRAPQPPKPTPPTPNPQTRAPQPPKPTPPTPNPQTRAPQPPKPTPPTPDTDAEGRWIPPALRGIDSDTLGADVEPTRRS